MTMTVTMTVAVTIYCYDYYYHTIAFARAVTGTIKTDPASDSSVRCTDGDGEAEIARKPRRDVTLRLDVE